MKKTLATILAFQVAGICCISFEQDAYAGNHVRPKRYVDKYLKARHGRHIFRLQPGGSYPLSKEYITNYHADRYVYEADNGLESIMKVSNPKLTRELSELYKKHIVAWAKHYSLPPLLVASVIHVESNFNVDCYYLGNYGPMQVNLTAHKDRLRKMGLTADDLKTVEYGVYVGCDILKECISGSGGDYIRALTWYNGAMDPAYASKVLRMYAYGNGKSK